MPAARVIISVATLAYTAARHPLVRAGVRQVLLNPKAQEKAIELTRSAAYNAGVLARKLTPRRFVD